jgi:hypothetical protein
LYRNPWFAPQGTEGAVFSGGGEVDNYGFEQAWPEFSGGFIEWFFGRTIGPLVALNESAFYESVMFD